jgi:hypothetical protein
MRESPRRIQDSDTARVRDRAGLASHVAGLEWLARSRRDAAVPRGSIDDYRIFFIDGVVCSS